MLGTVHHDVALFFAQLVPGLIGRDAQLGHGVDHPAHRIAVLAVPAGRGDGSLFQGQVRVGHDQIGVELHAHAQPLALRAGPVRAVETEGARLDLRKAAVTVHAGQVLAEQRIGRILAVGNVVDDHHPVALLEGGLDGVGQAADRGPRFFRGLVFELARHQPVDDDLDRVVLVAVQVDIVVDVVHLAVDAHAHEPGLADVLEDAFVAALAVLDDRRQYLDAPLRGHAQHGVDDLLRALGLDFLAAHRAVGNANPGVQQAQVVVDLSHGPDRGARVGAHALLVDGHRRTETLDLVDVGLFHLPQKLARIRAQTLHVAALPLREDRIESQRGLARAGQAGDDHQLVARDVHIHVLQIMFARAAHDNLILHDGSRPASPPPTALTFYSTLNQKSAQWQKMSLTNATRGLQGRAGDLPA